MITLTGFGSIAYHWLPNNGTLVWDRAPMAVMFMTLCLIIMEDRISSKVAPKLFWPTASLGVLSVVYWWMSELHGEGDLRLYGIASISTVLEMTNAARMDPFGIKWPRGRHSFMR